MYTLPTGRPANESTSPATLAEAAFQRKCVGGLQVFNKAHRSDSVEGLLRYAELPRLGNFSSFFWEIGQETPRWNNAKSEFDDLIIESSQRESGEMQRNATC